MRMERGWTMKVLLLVLALLSLMTPLVSARALSYQNLVNRSIKEFNKKTGSGNLFRLWVLNLQPGANNDPATPRPLSFTIKETVCSHDSGQNPDECDFKQDGLVKQCVGIIALDPSNPTVDVSCEGPEKIRKVRTVEKIQNFLNRVKEGYNRLKEKIKDKINDLIL